MNLGPAMILRTLSMVLIGFGTVAQAADSIAIDNFTVPAMGKVAAGSVTSTFTVDGSTGTVARASGDAVRVNAPGTVSTPTITVSCAPCNGNAASRLMTVTVTSTGSGRATLTSFTRTNMSSGVTFGGAATGSPLVFTIQFPGGSGTSTASFKLGMTVQVANTGATGVRSLPYQISTSRP
jgi:hypothetical protein